MPSRNLSVSSSSTIDSKAVFLGVVCTLANKPIDNKGVFDAYDHSMPDKKKARTKTPYITDVAELAKLLEAEPGEVCVVKQANEDEASRILKLAIQSDPRIAEEIKILKSLGVSYFIEVKQKPDLIKGSGDGAMGVGDPEGIDVKSPLYFQAIQNQASLSAIRDVDVKQHAAVEKLLTTLGNLVRISPDSPHKKKAVHFKYFLEEVSEVLSHLKRTHAPEALLPCAVTAVFAMYKHECWDAVMRLAADDAAKDLQACADVLLDAQHINNYLKFVEEAESTPPGPSREEFDVALGLLSLVDEETASVFRDLIVYLHDTVEPQVKSLVKAGAVQDVDGAKDGELESQIVQLNICLRNYLQTIYNIGQDFVEIERMPIPDEKAQLQAAMHNRIAGVSRKFWPALESSLKDLCDPTVVEDVKSKAQTLTKRLAALSLPAGQLAAKSTTVEDFPSESYWSRVCSFLGSLLGNKDGVKEDITERVDEDSMSPLFSDLLEIMDQLKSYGRVASASPEETPHVPDHIQPGDHVAICGALGFVSKPKAAAVFSYLKALQSYLEFVDYKSYASEEQLASIEKFLDVDYHMMKAIEDEGHSFGVHGNVEPEGCDQIMTSVFNQYFKECWPHMSAVLEGGDQEAASEKLKEMATDILSWKDSKPEVDAGDSQNYRKVKKLLDVNALWYLAGMSQFIKGAASEGWEWYDMNRKLWVNAICPYLKPGVNEMRRAYLSGRPWVICLPPRNKYSVLGAIAAQLLGDEWDVELTEQLLCPSLSPAVRVAKSKLYLSSSGDPDRAPRTPHTGTRGKDLMIYAKKHGVNLSCRRAFASRWYDASDQVINMLCNEALNSTLSKTPVRASRTRPLLDAYEFRLVTGDPGFLFEKHDPGAKYLGFLLCSGKKPMTNEALMDRIVRHKSSQKQRRAQGQCSQIPYESTWGHIKGMEYHGASVFHSTVKIKQNGRIVIRTGNHAAAIGDCWRALDKELRNSGFGVNSQENKDAIDRKECPIEGMNSGNQCMSSEAIVEAFREAEERGFIGLKSHYGHPSALTTSSSALPLLTSPSASPLITLPNALPLITPPSALPLTTSPSASHPSDGAWGPTTSSEALAAYWPYVFGVAGTIGTIFSAKRVWDHIKTRLGKGYTKVETPA